jgi:hypothetical protein
VDDEFHRAGWSHPAVGAALTARKRPLALLELRGFTLPDQIFSVDSAATAQALMTKTEDSDMDGTE